MGKPTASSQLPTTTKPRVALVTDWMYGGGSEKVVEQIHLLFPEAPIYTSYCSDEWRQRLNNKVVTGYLQKSPFRQLRKFLPLLRQWWFAGLDLSSFDLVISITGNGEAKFALSKLPTTNYQLPDAKRPIHISYCHTPVHFYWRHYESYLKNPGFRPKWLVRLGLKLLVRPLRSRDYKAAQKVDHLFANSSQIKNDIKKYYNRDSEVLFPPVDTTRFTSRPSVNSKLKNEKSKPRSGFVTMGRLVPMKKFDVIIEACNQLSLPLTVIGRGPQYNHLKALAGPTVSVRSDVSDEELPGLLAGAEAFLFASFEDFGIAPVEALASGTPVVAYQAGGALDYVIPGKTGEFFAEQTAESLMETLKNFNSSRYKQSDLQKTAARFSNDRFKKSFLEFFSKLQG